jgi:hypothetical protein
LYYAGKGLSIELVDGSNDNPNRCACHNPPFKKRYLVGMLSDKIVGIHGVKTVSGKSGGFRKK